MVKTIKEPLRKTMHDIHRFLTQGLLDSWQFVPVKDYVNIKKLNLVFKVLPYSMQNYARLSNAYSLAKVLEKSGTLGCFVECGVWRGGCAAIMAMAAKEARSNRKIWLFDSFEGMPEATFMDVGEEAQTLTKGRKTGRLVPVGSNVASIEDVKRLFFKELRFDQDNIRLVRGWFQDTLPKCRTEMGPIALLRVDADWYESTKVCLENLYDNVVEGGYVIIDDYGFFPGCRKAVDEFLEARNIKVELSKVDYTCVYFQKKEQ